MPFIGMPKGLPMSNDVLLKKLESLRRCVARVEKKSPANVLDLVEDYDLQDIIVLNLERAVQTCVDIGMHIIAESDLAIPDSMAETFRVLAAGRILTRENAEALARAVGFRNTAVHAYQEIDWHIVHAIATRHLGDFRQFAASILAYIKAFPD